jgi:hypothetical protein
MQLELTLKHPREIYPTQCRGQQLEEQHDEMRLMSLRPGASERRRSRIIHRQIRRAASPSSSSSSSSLTDPPCLHCHNPRQVPCVTFDALKMKNGKSKTQRGMVRKVVVPISISIPSHTPRSFKSSAWLDSRLTDSKRKVPGQKEKIRTRQPPLVLPQRVTACDCDRRRSVPSSSRPHPISSRTSCALFFTRFSS